MSTTQVELLKTLAKEIRDEHSVGANTATRVGTLLYALAERSYSLDDVADEYLSKIAPDTANELITFLKGVAFGTTYGITEEGVATLSKLGIGNSVLSVVDGNVYTTLSAHVFKGGEDITDSLSYTKFNWERVSEDTEGDSYWNSTFGLKTKSVIVTNQEVYKRAVFNCLVDLE